MTTNRVGTRTEARFIVKALEEGWEIATPFCAQRAYDFVVRRTVPLGWETVQVKTAYYARKDRNAKNNALEAGLRRSKGNAVKRYEDGDFDLLFVAHEDEEWLIPWSVVRGKTSAVQVGRAKYDEWRI